MSRKRLDCSSLLSPPARLGIGVLLGLVGVLTLSVALPWMAHALPALPSPGSLNAAADVCVLGGVCIVPDNGTGTVDLPPTPCQYVAPTDLMHIIDGLPPGTTIDITPTLHSFVVTFSGPGGDLGGERQVFEAILTMEMVGTGDLAGFTRVIAMPVGTETHIAPRTPGDPVQTFPTDMFQLQGQVIGDPDFQNLILTAGTNFGLPSPGQTTLTQLPSGDFAVDSFFDVTYQIDFVGSPGSVLDGLSGSTVGTVRMETESLYDQNLMIGKAVDPPTAAPGAPITYTLVFSNAGVSIATDVVITDTIPVSVTNTSVISSGAVITQIVPGYVWRVHDLMPGEGGVITVTGTLSPGLPGGHIFTNTVTIACAEAESSLADNQNAAGVTVRYRVYLPLVLRSS